MTLAEFIALPGHTASDVALRAGVAVSTITRAAKGDIKPTSGLMEAIHRATEGAVTPNDFFGIRPTPEKSEAAAA